MKKDKSLPLEGSQGAEERATTCPGESQGRFYRSIESLGCVLKDEQKLCSARKKKKESVDLVKKVRKNI